MNRPKDDGIPDEVVRLSLPFEATTAESYTAKVKTMLTGLPVTDAELVAVREDPEALGDLVDAWVETPEAQKKLLTFFGNAFQQTQFVADDTVDMLGGSSLRGKGSVQTKLVANLKESMSRTVLMMVNEGKPLTDTVTTQTFMMTPALMAFYAWMDQRQVSDRFGAGDYFFTTAAPLNFKVSNTTPIALSATLNPSDPNYMNWYVPEAFQAACTLNPRLFSGTGGATADLWSLVMGRLERDALDQTNCGPMDVTAAYTDDDFTSWKKVTIRQPANLDVKGSEEATTKFWDVLKMRSTNTLVLKVPRVGYFTTPAFFANWRTNTSNDSRGVTNQALIVALGKSFDPADSVVPIIEPGLDAAHADPTTSCYACHKSLDPMRQFFRKTYTYGFGRQMDAKLTGANAYFQFDGVTSTGQSIKDLASTFANHPAFAPAWAQKLCYYVDSDACSLDDPEFQRVVGVFQASGYNFKALVRALMTSPLVTGTEDTKTFFDRGIVVSIARYDHFCASLSNRLGVAACDLENGTVRSLAAQLPADAYSRGAEAPVLNSDTTLFFRGTTENLCRALSERVVDTTGSKYQSTNKDVAILDFVRNVMGLQDSDARSGPALNILQEHYADAVAAKAVARDALRSTFMLACQSPTSVAVGL